MTKVIKFKYKYCTIHIQLYYTDMSIILIYSTRLFDIRCRSMVPKRYLTEMGIIYFSFLAENVYA